jgi:predicted dehydrogenase
MNALRVVILGTGFGRTVQALGFSRHPGFELVGIAGSQAEKTRKIAEELGIPSASGDWRALLGSIRPDVVSVVTPAALHHPMMLGAVELGAHVLCEKPTALHRFQAAEMRERARAAGRVAAINHEFRFFPARRHALDLVRRGGIGVPRRGEILGRYPIWATPGSRGMSWLSDRAMGGGILGALGSHHTDCLRLFFGEPVRTLATVRVDQPRRGPTAADPREAVASADDACTVQYEFANGANGLVDLNASASYRWERFEIVGSEATLRWDDNGYRLWRLAPGREPEELAAPAEFQLSPREGDPQLVAPFGALIAKFHDAIVNGQPMQPNFDDAVAVQCALDSARLSSESGAWVNVESLAD